MEASIINAICVGIGIILGGLSTFITHIRGKRWRDLIIEQHNKEIERLLKLSREELKMVIALTRDEIISSLSGKETEVTVSKKS